MNWWFNTDLFLMLPQLFLYKKLSDLIRLIIFLLTSYSSKVGTLPKISTLSRRELLELLLKVHSQPITAQNSISSGNNSLNSHFRRFNDSPSWFDFEGFYYTLKVDNMKKASKKSGPQDLSRVGESSPTSVSSNTRSSNLQNEATRKSQEEPPETNNKPIKHSWVNYKQKYFREEPPLTLRVNWPFLSVSRRPGKILSLKRASSRWCIEISLPRSCWLSPFWSLSSHNLWKGNHQRKPINLYLRSWRKRIPDCLWALQKVCFKC